MVDACLPNAAVVALVDERDGSGAAEETEVGEEREDSIISVTFSRLDSEVL